MAESINLEVNKIRKELRRNDFENVDKFSLLKSVSLLVSKGNIYSQELILRILDKKRHFVEFQEIINALVREVGLFPYLQPELLNFKDTLAYEVHKPKGLESENIVFHRVQAEVYYKLLNGENIILSAPTSFGKSLIIDALLASGKYRNIAIILPTIALIDETRKRLSRFKGHYKIITHASQSVSDKNVFILTQERAVDIIDNYNIDFFVIDEFYKINPVDEYDNRSFLLNQILYKLIKKQAQFYMLGPNIEKITSAFPKEIQCSFIRTDYKTVVSEQERIKVKKGEDSLDKLIDLCNSLNESTLIYCKSPSSANKVALGLINSGIFKSNNENEEIIDWLRDNYHPQWLLTDALENNIGIHHGKTPRAISQYCVKAFNEGRLKFLVCTSTLIEGVNTKAKNVIIYDNKIASHKFDYFTFNNICGRSGRMFQHFIGKVFIFHDPPSPDLPFVDFPIFSQNESVPDKLLIQLNEGDLTKSSQKRLEKYFEQDLVSIDVLKRNANVDLQSQLDLATEIIENQSYYAEKLNWTGIPSYSNLEVVCDLIWRFLVKSKKRIYGISSGRQLTFQVYKFLNNSDIKSFISDIIGNETSFENVNKKIEEALDLLRHWYNFEFPRLLMIVNDIQQDVLRRLKLSYGNYSFFASQVECYFTDSTLIALDEYGLPIQISKKLQDDLKPNGNLDEVIERLRNLSVEKYDLSDAEISFINDVRDNI